MITLYGGAIRGGKTWWLILMIWIYAKVYPRSRWLILRNSVPTLTQTTLVTFQSLLDQGLAADMTNWSAINRTATLYNGSQIIFMAEAYDTDKELNRFRGLEINGAGIDEINEIQEATFNKVIERSGSWQHSPGCPIKIISTCNPTQNWVKQKFYDRWKSGTLPSSWAYVPAKITDNPHIDPAYIESLKELPPYQYQMFVEGDWEVMPRTGGEFYKLFDFDRNVSRDVQYNPLLALHLSFDFNVNPYMTCCVWQVQGKKAIQIDEICLPSPKNTTKAVCAEVRNRYAGHTAGVFIYGDPSGMKEDTRSEKGFNDFVIIRGELAQFRPTLRVAKQAPPVVMRGNFINQVFYNGFNGLEISIGHNCTHTIADYLYCKEAPDGTKLKEKARDAGTGVNYEKYGHTSDANDYFICSAFAAEFALYQKGGVNTRIGLGRNVSKNSW